MSPPSLHPAPLPPNLSSILASLVTPKRSLSSLTLLYTSTHSTLPSTILSRSPSPHLLHEDLIAIMDSKLTFGQNRPALRSMIAKLSSKEVISTSTSAFQALLDSSSSSSTSKDRIEKALKALLPLKGVGPATASLILSLVSEEVPFFSDEAAVEVLKPSGGRKGLKYTLPEYWKYFEGVGERSELEGTTGGRRGWERNIWAEKVLEAAGGKEGAEEETSSKSKDKAAKAPSASVSGKKRAFVKEEEVVVDEEGTLTAGGRPKRLRTTKQSA
ncbi:hypothetical protein BDY24DRAFT_415314 [Mrakia frigida]|uniref:uncharacterized protein n=1 Tax=Mrakia frigida TaxID=29902 RepID=UPI003FCC1642